MYFNEATGGRYVPRAVLVDLVGIPVIIRVSTVIRQQYSTFYPPFVAYYS